MKFIQVTAVLAIAGLAGLLLAVSLREHGSPAISGGMLLNQPRALPAFELQDQKQQAFGPEQLRGKWHLVFTGFTHCPDLCPNTLALLKAMEQQLGEDAALLTVLFVSVDPKRDSPEQLARYLDYFSPSFVGVTGDDAQIALLMQGLGLGYSVGDTAATAYDVDHSATLVLLNPQAQVTGYFPAPHTAAGLASDMKILMGS